MAESTGQAYHVHITARRRWFDLELRELWRYRDLIWLLTARSLRLTYRQTVLGPAWIFLNPLLTGVVYTLVFGAVTLIGTGGVPPLLFYLCGSAVWGFFAACLTKNAATFTNNAALFGKVYFPRLTIPLSNVLSAVVQLGAQLLLLGAFLLYYVVVGAVSPHWLCWLLLPPVLLHLGILALGCGLIVSALTTRYRDLSVLVTFGVQLWMFATPVLYPLSRLGPGRLRTLLLLNPVAAPVELFRYAVLGEGVVAPAYLLLSWVVTLAVAALGAVIFHRVEGTFMDTV